MQENGELQQQGQLHWLCMMVQVCVSRACALPIGATPAGLEYAGMDWEHAMHATESLALLQLVHRAAQSRMLYQVPL